MPDTDILDIAAFTIVSRLMGTIIIVIHITDIISTATIVRTIIVDIVIMDIPTDTGPIHDRITIRTVTVITDHAAGHAIATYRLVRE